MTATMTRLMGATCAAALSLMVAGRCSAASSPQAQATNAEAATTAASNAAKPGEATISITAGSMGGSTQISKSSPSGAGLIEHGRQNAILNRPVGFAEHSLNDEVNCVHLATGKWHLVNNVLPKHGIILSFKTNGFLPDGKCPNTRFDFEGLGYKWTDADAPIGTPDKFRVVWKAHYQGKVYTYPFLGRARLVGDGAGK